MKGGKQGKKERKKENKTKSEKERKKERKKERTGKRQKEERKEGRKKGRKEKEFTRQGGMPRCIMPRPGEEVTHETDSSVLTAFSASFQTDRQTAEFCGSFEVDRLHNTFSSFEEFAESRASPLVFGLRGIC